MNSIYLKNLLWNCIFPFILTVIISSLSIAQTPLVKRTITSDYTAIKGKHNKFFRETVGAGRAAEGLRADWQAQFETVRRDCGFEYIRFHGLLQDEMGIYSEDKNGNAKYNFQYVDALYDAILQKGMKPFVEFGFMPEKLASGNKTIFWWKGNITPPKDYAKWANLIKALVEHWTNRYGEKEVANWYFEVWNEPNLDIFWSGTQADYFKLFEVSAKAIKSVSKNYQVGGPATAGNGWVPETIDFATKNNVPIDFISTHDYGVKGIGFDSDGKQKLFLDTSSDAIIGNVRQVKQQIITSAKPTLPLHYTEWSTSYSPRDPVHDSYLSAPYILSKLKGTEGFADSMSYWTFTDIFEENGTVPSPFHGGFGLINFQGLKKPSFYAYKFLNALGDEELVNKDAESWVCRSKNGVQILLWNYSPPITTESDQEFYKKDFPTKDFGTAQISIANLPANNYKMNIYRIGYGINDVYTEYLKLGSPSNLSREQVKTLAEKTSGAPFETSSVKIKTKQVFKRDLQIRENDVFLITLEKN